MDNYNKNLDVIVQIDGTDVLIEHKQTRLCADTARIFRECRVNNGITQAELGKLAGVSQPNITRFESGNYNPSLEFLVKIAAAMKRKVAISLGPCDISVSTP